MGLGIKPPLYHCVDHAGKAPCPNCVPFGALSSTPAKPDAERPTEGEAG